MLVTADDVSRVMSVTADAVSKVMSVRADATSKVMSITTEVVALGVPVSPCEWVCVITYTVHAPWLSLSRATFVPSVTTL